MTTVDAIPLLCAAAGAVAAALAVPAPRVVRSGSLHTGSGSGPGGRPGSGWRRVHLAVGGGLALGVAIALLPGRTVLLAGVLLGAGGGGVRLWRLTSTRRAAERTAVAVREVCVGLAAELEAGQPPGTALDRVAREWPPLAPVAEAHRVGADVPTALRSLASLPGAGDLRYVAAAWQVSHRTGHGLAAAVTRVAAQLRADAATRRVVEGELASARATARLVAGLPVLALVMGSGAGGDPWAFLLGTDAGLVCLAGGLAFGVTGLTWIERIAGSVVTPPRGAGARRGAPG